MKKQRNFSPQPKKKKHLGQHFLISQEPITTMLSTISVTPETAIIEIGCGDGVLSKALLAETPCKALHIIEIDDEWADVVQNSISDPRLTIHRANALDFDLPALCSQYERVVLMANLPYLITFPLFEKFSRNPELFAHAIVMLQEEAAQRIASTTGRKYGAVSVYLQYYFDFVLHEKVGPEQFSPPPNVMSRLLSFKPKAQRATLPDDHEAFWKFVRTCFASPRQTLRNNLKGSTYNTSVLSEKELSLRAQQMTFDDFISCFERCVQK
jgi:16S rRNA (adenine1518-N6/adenine1519-N6)-dimethyltransferase